MCVCARAREQVFVFVYVCARWCGPQCGCTCMCMCVSLCVASVLAVFFKCVSVQSVFQVCVSSRLQAQPMSNLQVAAHWFVPIWAVAADYFKLDLLNYGAARLLSAMIALPTVPASS